MPKCTCLSSYYIPLTRWLSKHTLLRQSYFLRTSLQEVTTYVVSTTLVIVYSCWKLCQKIVKWHTKRVRQIISFSKCAPKVLFKLDNLLLSNSKHKLHKSMVKSLQFSIEVVNTLEKIIKKSQPSGKYLTVALHQFGSKGVL